MNISFDMGPVWPLQELPSLLFTSFKVPADLKRVPGLEKIGKMLNDRRDISRFVVENRCRVADYSGSVHYVAREADG